MRRRDFNLGLLTAGVAPMVPLPSVAATPPAAAVAPVAAANFTPYAYAMSAEYARSVPGCSATALSERFGLPAQVAEAIHGRLLRSGVIAPNAIAAKEAAKQAAKPRNPPQQASKELARVKAKAKDLLTPDNGAPADQTAEDAEDPNADLSS